MRCPWCNVPMREVERRGVRIDVCPECRGVWLDRGELEKLLASAPAAEWGDEEDVPSREADEREARRRSGEERRWDESYHRKRKKGWLSEIFDFDFGD